MSTPSWIGAARAAAAVLGPRAMMGLVTRSTREEDETPEAVVRAMVIEGRDQAAWLGVTGMASSFAIDAAVAAFAAKLGWGAELRDACLDERRQALLAAGLIETAFLDLKLAQLMSTTLCIIDVVRPVT
jgi:hypothetical protein